MGTTTTNGYYKPSTGETGWFDELNTNTDNLDAHDHTGAAGYSERLTTASTIGVKQTITSAGWSSAGGGMYTKTITMPAGLDYSPSSYDVYSIEIRLSTGEKIYPKITRVDVNQYLLTINENGLDLIAIYG